MKNQTHIALQIVERNAFQYDWITLIFLVVLILIVFINYKFKDKLKSTFYLFFSTTFFSESKRKEISLLHEFHFYLFSIQLMLFSLGIFFFIENYLNSLFDIYNFITYLTIVLYLLSFYVIRYLIGFLIKEIFNIQQFYKYYSYVKFSYLSTIVLWMFPLLILLTYTILFQELIYNFIFVLVLALFLFRYVFIVLNNKNLILSKLFYFILYLCTLEIAPAIIVIKLIN